ncbi:ATP-binding protein [Ottowia sp.]|uniref:hybrid sensor histidine kinase/response regulator n=1 Tax=Ottowia sp. TaxID=1898956 RepID=UPI00394CCEF5
MNWRRLLPGNTDVTQPVLLMLLTRLGELLGALLFLAALPWWRPALWFALVLGASTWGFVRVRRPDFKALPRQQRRRIYRSYIWLSSAAIGSACWFLYAPGDQRLHAMLGLYLVASAGLVAMWGVRDIQRTALAVVLILGPTVLRFMVEGLFERRPMVFFLGASGVVLAAMIVYTAALHAQRIARESVLRRQAERAVDAMADLSLAKSRFFAAVSHDLRQPVHAIGLYLEPLARTLGPQPDPLVRHALHGIHESWRALDDLLSQVLDITRMDAGAMLARLEPIALAPLVRAVVQQHGAMAERVGVRVVALVRETAGCHVRADDIMLRRVLSNLLDNAIKFSPAGRCVAVAVRPGARDCRIQVRDAGPGIAADRHDDVFHEFVQLDNQARNRQRGYGLGLAISRRFAELMQGCLTLRSAPGQGTCFTLTLPGATAPPTLAPEPEPEAPGSAPTEPGPLDAPPLPARDILLVEDDALVADAMCQLLGLWGQNVRHVETVAEAWRLRDFGQLAICDVRLPDGGNGFELALRLRALGKPVFLLSGEIDADLKARAAAADLPLLTKPLSAARMRALLRAL